MKAKIANRIIDGFVIFTIALFMFAIWQGIKQEEEKQRQVDECTSKSGVHNQSKSEPICYTRGPVIPLSKGKE